MHRVIGRSSLRIDVREPLIVGLAATEQPDQQQDWSKKSHQTFPMQVLASKYALLVDP